MDRTRAAQAAGAFFFWPALTWTQLAAALAQLDPV